MQKHPSFTGLFMALAFSILNVNAHAQQPAFLQKAKDKARDVIEKKTGRNGNISAGSENADLTNNDPFDFIPGDSLLFAEDFSGTRTGSSPATIKTNSKASVTSVDGQTGKWLALQDKAIYKLARQHFYPKHFTVEFDILASADRVKDISPLSFGFDADNSVREYTSNAGAYVELHYYDANQVNIGNSRLQKYANTTFDLSTDLNRPLHVSLTIEGERMVVYLNKTKLADTILFNPSDPRNFYITAPWQYEQGARILVSNFRIAAFKKGTAK